MLLKIKLDINLIMIIQNNNYNNENFNEYFKYWDFELSNFQKWAIQGIIEEKHVVVTAHTGSGKTLPAEFAVRHFTSMKKKVVYTTPIKALSNEKFNDFQKKFPEISFGIITGDIKFNPEADVLIMTTECLLNTLYQRKMLEEGSLESKQVELLFEMDVSIELGCVIFDEIHYINDPDRGHVWEETIMILPNHVQIIGLSATIHKPEKLCNWIEKTKKKPVWLCPNEKRVVPLTHYSFLTLPQSTLEKFPKEIKNLIEDNNFYENGIVLKNKDFDDITYSKINKVLKYFKQNNIWVDKKFVLNRVVDYLYRNDLMPSICFVFSQKKCEEYASTITKVLFDSESKVPATMEQSCRNIMMKLPNYQEYINLPEYVKLVKLLEKGIAYHHAGMATVFREMIEILFSKGHVKLLFATETFSVGINMPTRSVLFTSMKKFSNKGFRFIKSHEYTQMSGRAGRRGIDKKGYVFHLTNFYGIQNSQPPVQTMREIFSSKPAIMESKFKINVNIILKLISIGNNNFQTFVDSSLVKDSIDKQINIFKDILISLKKKIKKKKEILKNCIISIEDMEKYKEIEDKINMVHRKKRKGLLIIMENIKNKSKQFDNNYNLFISLKETENEILKTQDNLKNVSEYVNNEIGNILQLLEEEKFIVKEIEKETKMLTMYNSIEIEKINYKLTERGQIASNINELHPLVMANILEKRLLNSFEPIEIASILSIFTHVKLSDENNIHNKNDLNLSKKIINAIENIEKEHKYFYDKQLIMKLEDIQSEYLDGIHYNLCDFMNDWFKHCNNPQDCYKYISEMKLYGMSLGKIIKSILKINNIVDEIEKVSLIQNNFELIEKMKIVREKTLKFIVTNQSLYL